MDLISLKLNINLNLKWKMTIKNVFWGYKEEITTPKGRS